MPGTSHILFRDSDAVNKPVSSDNPLPVSVSTSITASENLAQVGGNNVDVNSGNKSNGTLRVVLATDQPALATALPSVAAQASTTSGQTGLLAEAAVVSGDQSYTAGQTNPLTLTATGRLRVGLSSAGSVTPGTAGTNSDLIAGVYQSAPGTATDGQQRALQQTAAGNLKVDGSSVTQPVSVAATLPVDGATASGASIANPPVTTGGRAATTNPTAVTDGQVVNAMFTKHGKMVVVDGAPRELRKTQKTTLSNTTTETTIVTAGGAGVFNDVYKLIFANTGATTTKVDIRDATAGSIIETIEVPAGDTRGWSLPAGSAVPQTTANNNWTAQCASATTAMEISVSYVQTT